MSQFIDAGEQREKARRAEQQLLLHDQVRQPAQHSQAYRSWYRNGDAYDEDDRPDALPPVFRRDGEVVASRPTSVDKRAIRFRDGLPPPPLVLPPDSETPRYLPPPAAALVPQELFDAGLDPRIGYPPPVPMLPSVAVSTGLEGNRFAQPFVEPPSSPTGVEPALTPSQKKRLRKLKAKQRALREAGASLLSPPPPTYTDPQYDPAIAQHQCDAGVMVVIEGRPTIFRCPLSPFPHPGQPHFVKLQPVEQDGTEIFVGWWNPGE